MSPAPFSAIDNKLGHRAVRAWLQLRGSVFETERTESVKPNSKNSRMWQKHYTDQIEHRNVKSGDTEARNGAYSCTIPIRIINLLDFYLDQMQHALLLVYG